MEEANVNKTKHRKSSTKLVNKTDLSAPDLIRKSAYLVKGIRNAYIAAVSYINVNQVESIEQRFIHCEYETKTKITKQRWGTQVDEKKKKKKKKIERERMSMQKTVEKMNDFNHFKQKEEH